MGETPTLPVKANRRGFTLLETVIAFAIAGLGVAALVAASHDGLLASDVSAQRLEALTLAQSRLAEADPMAGPVQTGLEANGMHWRLTLAPLSQRPPDALARPPRPGVTLYQITVAETWSGGREINLSSRRLQVIPAKPVVVAP